MLSDEEYNILKNSKTPEELWSIKDSLMNSDALLKYHDKKYISIQCLSSEQYNNYIKNGTLDGAIEKNNVNTWHYDNSNKSMTFLCVGGNQFNEAASYASSYPNHIRITAQSVAAYNTRYTGEYNIGLVELLNNNSLNSSLFFINDYTIYLCSVITTNGVGTGYGISTTYIRNLESIAKNLTTYSKLAVKPMVYLSYFKHYEEVSGVNLTLKLSTGFRPVFKFIDNNKSKTIYY